MTIMELYSKWYAGNMIIFPGLLGKGNVFFVDPANGNDGNSGASALNAKASMQAAIDLCVDWQGDRIVRMKGTETVTEPVLFNKAGITVQAQELVSPYGGGERFVTYGSHTDGPAAFITKPCRLIGLGFCGSEVLGGSVEMDCEEAGAWAGAWNLMLNCRFTHWSIAKAYGLIIRGTAENVIKGCMFDGLWTGYGEAAIGLEDSGDQGVWNLTLEDNRFYNIGAGKYCIQLAADTHFYQGLVSGNKNIGSALFFNAAGEAGTAMFYDNYTGHATNATSYSDTVGNLQILGYGFCGNHYSE